tara:strand:- start:295 stop:1023 length:729 start_codon:yes stop_codon:yes gene_type:complete
MGAGTLQKGALGQQLAASGQARRAEAISRKGKGRGPVGKGRARAVIEDRMDQNDREGKQKQGGKGMPGRPSMPEGRPSMPPMEDGMPGFFPPKEGRPFEPPMEGRPPKEGRPPREGRPPMPPKEGRPPIDDRVRPLPYPPRGGRGDYNINLPDGRPPSKRPIRGKDQFGPGEGYLPERPPFGEGKGPRGGTEFGPGRGSRIPEGPEKGMPIGNDQLPKGFKGTGFLQDFLARISQLKGGGIR